MGGSWAQTHPRKGHAQSANRINHEPWAKSPARARKNGVHGRRAGKGAPVGGERAGNRAPWPGPARAQGAGECRGTKVRARWRWSGSAGGKQIERSRHRQGVLEKKKHRIPALAHGNRAERAWPIIEEALQPPSPTLPVVSQSEGRSEPASPPLRIPTASNECPPQQQRRGKVTNGPR